MSTTAGFWDGIYDVPGFRYGLEPSAFLVRVADGLTAGRALVPGDGEGRNGVFLAERGWEVTTIDLSAIAAEKARALAKSRGVPLDAQVGDVLESPLPEGRFDLVFLGFVHLPPSSRPALHRRLAGALAPGGAIVVEGFSLDQLAHRARGSRGGPPDADMLYTEPMLGEDFSGLSPQILHTVTTDFGEDGAHSGTASLVQAVFTRPTDDTPND